MLAEICGAARSRPRFPALSGNGKRALAFSFGALIWKTCAAIAFGPHPSDPAAAKTSTKENLMHKFVFLTRLALGAFCLAVLASAPIFFASAQEGQEHEMISGVVQKVDASAGKIPLKHWPIKSLGMEEGMTMVLPCRTPASLKALKRETRSGSNPTVSSRLQRSRKRIEEPVQSLSAPTKVRK